MALADGTALYRIWGDADLLLYIGVSDDFGSRWKQHAKQQPWWDEMRRLTVDAWYESRAQAEAAEQAAIKAEAPKYNKQHVTPGSREEAREEVLALLTSRLKPLLLTYRQAAALLDVSMSKLHQMIRDEEILSLKLGSQMARIPTEQCEAYLDRKMAQQYGPKAGEAA